MLLLLTFFHTPAVAQLDQSSLLSATSAGLTNSNYYFSRPGEISIIVNVVGFVNKPGRYEIGSSIDLLNLLSLAGGPTSDGGLADVKITRLVQKDSLFARKEIVINLDDLTKVRQAELALFPGDFIEVHRTGWSIAKDVIGIVSTTALITTAVLNVVYLLRRP